MERKEDYRWTEESENMNDSDWPRDTTTSHHRDSLNLVKLLMNIVKIRLVEHCQCADSEVAITPLSHSLSVPQILLYFKQVRKSKNNSCHGSVSFFLKERVQFIYFIGREKGSANSRFLETVAELLTTDFGRRS